MREALVPILENPSATFDDMLNGGHLGKDSWGKGASEGGVTMKFEEGKYARRRGRCGPILSNREAR